jgi:hypothetical protein
MGASLTTTRASMDSTDVVPMLLAGEIDVVDGGTQFCDRPFAHLRR